VKANVAQFELAAAKQKQSQLKTQMEDLAQISNAQAIELEKAKEKLRQMEEAAYAYRPTLPIATNLYLLDRHLIYPNIYHLHLSICHIHLSISYTQLSLFLLCACGLSFVVHSRRAKAGESDSNAKALEEERRKAKELEDQLRKMRDEKDALERQKKELKRAVTMAEQGEPGAAGASAGGVAGGKGGAGGVGGAGAKGEKGEKGDSASSGKATVNVTVQTPGQAPQPGQGPIIIHQKDNNDATFLLQQQQAHINSLQERQRLEAEARFLAEKEKMCASTIVDKNCHASHP